MWGCVGARTGVREGEAVESETAQPRVSTRKEEAHLR